MNVLLANKFFYMNGGSEKVFFQERDFLLRKSVRVIDFSMKDPRNFQSSYADYFVANIDYYSSEGVWRELRKAATFIHSPEAVAKVRRLVQNGQPDIAHLHNIYHQLTPSIISVLKKSGVKVVLTLHDGKLICPNYLMLAKGKICTTCAGNSFRKPVITNCTGSLRQAFLLMLEAYWHKWAKSYDRVDLFLSPSRFLAELLSQRITKEKIKVLHNGIDLESYRPTYNDHGYALYFGRLSKEKGIETLLQAHKTVTNGTTLKVVGTGPLESDLKSRYQEAEFLGYRSGEALKKIVANAAFVVVPSEWYENCPMVVLEAMAMGKPVIGSAIGGIPEQIDHGKTGFLFEMGNVSELTEKIRVLSENSDMRRRMGMAARKKVEQAYSLDVHCTTLMQIYKAVLSRNSMSLT